MSIAQLRERLETIPGRHRPNLTRTGAIGLVLIAVVFVFGGYASVTGYLPFVPRGGHLVEADFKSAFNLNTSTPVRIKGIGFGQVEKIESRDGGRSARVTMRVDDEGARLLRSDARAAIWQRLVLGGPQYIELTPGKSAAPLGDSPIPLSRTSTQVGVDQVLNALTPGARTGLAKTLKGVDEAFADEPATRAALAALAPGLRPLAPAIRGVRGTHDGDLGTMVKGFDEIAVALARDERALAGIVDGAHATLAVTAARRADLGHILDRAPAVLATTRRELAGADGTLDILDPLADELRPGARRVAPALGRLEPALADTRTLLGHAEPLVERLDPAVRRLRDASRQGVPLMTELDPTVNRTKRSLLPFLTAKDEKIGIRNYQLIGPTVAAVDSLAGLYDANGHVAAFNGSFGSRAFHDFQPCAAYLTTQSLDKKLICQNLLEFFTGMFGGEPPSSRATASLAKLLGVKK